MGKVTIIEKHSRFTRWLHWIHAPLLGIMIWSGILIYWADQAFVKIPMSVVQDLDISFHLAEGMGWHFLIMWPFTITGILYVAFLIKQRSFNPSYNKIQRKAYLAAVIVAALSILSGLAIYKPVQLGWITFLFGGYENARLIHFIMMVVLVIFIIIHLTQVIRHGWNNLRSMITGYEIEKK